VSLLLNVMCKKKIGVAGVGVGPVCGVDSRCAVHPERARSHEQSVDEYLNKEVGVGGWEWTEREEGSLTRESLML